MANKDNFTDVIANLPQQPQAPVQPVNNQEVVNSSGEIVTLGQDVK